MKKIDYLFESAHPGGTYSSLIPSVESREELLNFCVQQGIENLVDPDEYHCTLIYSKHPCMDVADEDFGLPCKALPIGWKALGKEKKVLVLEIYCPNATRLHELFMEKHGATHDYPEYIAHITVADNAPEDISKLDTPDFEIEFSGYTVEELS